MIPRLTADFILVIHFVFIAFVVLGGFLVLKWRKVALLHIPCVLWGALVELAGWICPLTPLEFHLREAAGGEAYGGDFIDRYLMPLIYPEGLTRSMQISLGVAILAINLFLYALALFLRTKRPPDQARRED
jgi:hypothetical protein